jgi:hypothetical protein
MATNAAIRESRRRTLEQWTGISNFQQFCEDTECDREVVRPGPIPLFTLREKLLIFLICTRKGLSFSCLKLLVGLGRNRTTEIWKEILEELVIWSQHHIHWPDLDQWASRRSQEFVQQYGDTYMFFVDGTVLPVLMRLIQQSPTTLVSTRLVPDCLFYGCTYVMNLFHSATITSRQ